jgi:hypothetical protein
MAFVYKKTEVEIPPDTSLYILYLLLIVGLLLLTKIVYRWWRSYKVEYILYDLLKGSSVDEKKKKSY